MLQLNNKTPFAAILTTIPDENGIDTIYPVVKATFSWQGKWILKEAQSKPREADEYFDEPGKSSIKYPSDCHTGKVGTDIVMIGSACAPERQPVRQMDVCLNVAGYRKVVRIFGERFWSSGKISSPELFETMRLRYENAYGGEDIVENKVIASYARNPVGTGFLGSKKPFESDMTRLPNLENPLALIEKPTDSPLPACFGVISPNWEPRIAFAGTYDEDWTKQRAPFLPLDYSSRFMNFSAPELWVEDGLTGGAPISISNMHPGGELNFTLPEVCVGCRVDVAGVKHEIKMALETLLLEPNKLEVSMVWRGSLNCDKQLLRIRSVELFLSR